MLKPFLFLLLLWFYFVFPNLGHAQEPPNTYRIRGVIVDSLANIPLDNAVIKLLRAEDSIFVDFKRSSTSGDFLLKTDSPGSFIMIASYPNYTDYVNRIKLDSTTKNMGLEKINLLPLPKVLEEVIVVGKSAITIKGDTIEYDPASFVIQPNSRVEDLLKQLPGLQVDRNGQITARGKIVKKVLLDGEEFLSDDPTLITRNIRGDMISKVQLYDRKSKQAEFTGIDDGRKETTINIELKEDKKNGYFGKVQTGLGTSDFHEGQGMFNKFSNSRKMALFGTIANTAVTGLSRNDSKKYAGQNEMSPGFNSEGMISRDELEETKFTGKGIPQVYSGGIHYDGRWRDRKESLNLNYKIGSLEIEGFGSEEELRNPSDDVFKRSSDQQFRDRTFRQVLDGKYENAIDSLTTIVFSFRGGQKSTNINNKIRSSSQKGSGHILNENFRTVENKGEERFVQTDLLWNKKLNKPGRTLSIYLDQVTSRINRNNFLNSETRFFISNPSQTNLVDQLKREESNNFNLNTSIVYTEPLSDKISISGNYRFNYNNGKSLRNSFNNSGDHYDELDSLYSNVYRLKQSINMMDVNLIYNHNKNLLNIGISGSTINFNQEDISIDTLLKKNFSTINPSLEWTYKLSEGKSLKAGYKGKNILPKIYQIQPLIDNLDPLNKVVGNPDLKPSFIHSVSGSYTAYNILSGKTFMVSLNTSAFINDISSNIILKENGESSYKFENIHNRTPLSFSSYIYYGGKWKSLDISWGSILNLSHSKTFNILNDQLNRNSTNMMSIYVNLSKSVKQKFDFSLEAGPTYVDNTSSGGRTFSSKGWGANSVGSATWYLPWKISVLTDINYTYLPATDLFNKSLSRFIWNAALNKRFLKTEQLSLRLGVNDLLNNNQGFTRVAKQGSILETNYNTINRYLMISLIWDFNRN